jgi:hypothetical protein
MSLHGLLIICSLIVISLENCFQDLVGAELEEVLQINGKQLRGAAIRRLEDRVLGALTEEGICKELAAMPKEVPQEAQVSSWEEEELIVDEGLVDEGDVHVTPVPKKPITEVAVDSFLECLLGCDCERLDS